MSRGAGREPEPLRGDEGALFEQHAHRLVRVVQRRVRAPADVVEEGCAFAWFQLVRTQPEREHVFGWLRVVATREAIRIARREGRDLRLEAGADDGGEDATDLAAVVAGEADVERSAEVREALAEVARLPERRRRIFELHLAGLSYEEIAARTDEGHRAIDRQIRKARTRLRSRLGPQAGDTPSEGS